MKRAENVEDCKIDHVWVENDSIVFQFAKSKGMQEGEDHVGPWHVYANASSPNVCHFLAVGKYLFTYPELLSSNAGLFPGKSQYERFSTIFHDLTVDFADELKVYGVEVGDLGTHSTRKGVGTAICAGCTMSPPIVSVCIRCGWVMGGVKDRYLKYESAGDQFVGRCAACLDLLSSEFAIFPPHFDFSASNDGVSLTAQEELVLQGQLEAFLRERLPNYQSISPSTLGLTRMLLASICYNYEYLQRTLSLKNAFRASPIFRDIPETLLKHCRVSYPWAKSRYTPSFTGLPPHVLQFTENEEIKAEITGRKRAPNGKGSGVRTGFERNADHLTCT